jgi:hypothetical protein
MFIVGNCSIGSGHDVYCLADLVTLGPTQLTYWKDPETVKNAVSKICDPSLLMGFLISHIGIRNKDDLEYRFVNLKTLAYAIHHDCEQLTDYITEMDRKTSPCVICGARKNIGHDPMANILTKNPVCKRIIVHWAPCHTVKVDDFEIKGGILLRHHTMTYGHDHVHQFPIGDDMAFDAVVLDELSRTIASIRGLRDGGDIYPPSDFYSPLYVVYNNCSHLGKAAIFARAWLYVFGDIEGISVWKAGHVGAKQVAQYMISSVTQDSAKLDLFTRCFNLNKMPISNWIARMPDKLELFVARLTISLR